MIEEIKTFEERKEELIKKGKLCGFITYEQLANGLKGLEIDSDALTHTEDDHNKLIDLLNPSLLDTDNKLSKKTQ